jgi:hypothetical protein
MLRAAGLILLGLAAAALAADWLGRGEDGLAAASIAERWFQLHRPSFIGLQSGIENRVSPELYFDYVLPVLELPAAGVAAILGAVLLLGARVRGRR